MYTWHYRLFCTVCDYNIRACGNKSDMFHAMTGVGGCCPKCGTEVETRRMVPQHGKPFVNKLVRWTNTSIWFKPSTWRRGYWEEKDGGPASKQFKR